MANKFFAKKVWIVPGNEHMFRSEHDAKYYCQQNDIDFSTVEKYDSTKEYYRWLELQQKEKDGEISELKRQVEFELAEPVFFNVLIRMKKVKRYAIPLLLMYNIPTKEEAKRLCRANNLRQSDIVTKEQEEPVFKAKKILDRAVYTADFVYVENGESIVEDVKSEYTRKEKDYVLRKKWLYQRFGILITET